MTQDNVPEILKNPEIVDVLKRANNLAMNINLHKIDEDIRGASPDPALQMGILMMAQALAFRRLCAARSVKMRAQKQTLLRYATKDFMAKITAFGFETNPPISQVRDTESQ